MYENHFFQQKDCDNNNQRPIKLTSTSTINIFAFVNLTKKNNYKFKKELLWLSIFYKSQIFHKIKSKEKD